MTDEEINRKFDVVAEHLASLAVGQQALQEQIAETNKKLQIYSETQSEFIEFVKRHIEEQGELNKYMRETDRRLAELLARLGEAVAGVSARGAQTDARLDRLAESQARADDLRVQSDARLERIAEAQARADELRAQSDARLDRLAAIIERHVSDGHGG